MTGIYKITSPTYCVYIGQSHNISARISRYKNTHSINGQPAIERSLIKHGADAHSFQVIHELPEDVSQSVLNEYERFYMSLYKDCGARMLNIRDGGSDGKLSSETKHKLSSARIGIKLSQNTKEKLRLANLGKRQSSETKEKKRIASTGKKHSEDSKLRMSILQKGKKLSSETIEKIKIARGRQVIIRSEATKIKMSKSRKGKKMSEEAKKKLSDINIKNPVNFWLGKKRGERTEEERNKISEGLKLAWINGRKHKNP